MDPWSIVWRSPHPQADVEFMRVRVHCDPPREVDIVVSGREALQLGERAAVESKVKEALDAAV